MARFREGRGEDWKKPLTKMMAQFTKRQWLTLIVISIADFANAICVSLQAPFYPQEVSRAEIGEGKRIDEVLLSFRAMLSNFSYIGNNRRWRLLELFFAFFFFFLFVLKKEEVVQVNCFNGK